MEVLNVRAVVPAFSIGLCDHVASIALRQLATQAALTIIAALATWIA